MNFPNKHHKNWIADNVMRIATEILGVKGLKAHNNWSQQRLYTEWLQISMVLIFIWDDLTSYWFRNFKNRFVPSQPHTSYFKDASNTTELRCGTANPMICVLQFFKAQVYRSNFESFCQKFVISSVRQVRIVIVFLTIFCQSSKVLYHSTLGKDKFVSSVKSDRFFKLWFKGKH